MSERLTRFFGTRGAIVLIGAVIGVLGALLEKMGNPPNMGVCVACFERDIAGALGLHRAASVQYIRSEIVAFVLGSMLAAVLFREFRPRSGSAPLVRFTLGVFAMIGALVFMGCPWRALFRLAGGDMTALGGLAGMAAGVGAGVWFLKRGFDLGRAGPASLATACAMPIAMGGLFLLLILRPQFAQGGPIFFSSAGPGSMHAPIIVSTSIGLVIGFLAQRTRFCTMGSFRDLFLMGNTVLAGGVVALVCGAFLANIALGQFHPGIEAQPAAHSGHLWNFLGMGLAGLAFALGGGCPGRQLFLSGEGDEGAGIFVLGMFAGAAISHNLDFAAIPDKVAEGVTAVGGPSTAGKFAVILGLAVCAAIGALLRENPAQ